MIFITLFSLLFTSNLQADDILDIINADSSSSKEAEIVEINERFSPLVESIKKDFKKTTAEQNIFFRFLSNENYKKALYQWPSAMEKSSFSRSNNGKALYQFILYKNGLKLNALESLVSEVNAKKINEDLKRAWLVEAEENKDLWDYVETKWHDSWTPVFGKQIAAIVESKRLISKNKIEDLVKLIQTLPKDSYVRSTLVWRLAIEYALNDDIKKSAKLISHLLKTKELFVGEDLLNITIARLLYQSGHLDTAISYYKKVPKSSDYWFLAKEEIAWSYIRKGEPQNTLAVTKGLVIDDFQYFVGPETVFLRSLAHLKICDYPSVQKDISIFKERFRKKALVLTELISQPQNKDTIEVVGKLEKSRLTRTDIGSLAIKMPYHIQRDERLYHLSQILKQSKIEADTAEKLYSSSLNNSSAQVGFMASIEWLKKDILKRKQKARANIFNRIKELAKQDLNNIHQMLQKMHIVEAEFLQQITTANKLAMGSDEGSTKKGTTATKDKYSLEFPFDGEQWFDEIDNYQVDVSKACTKKKEL